MARSAQTKPVRFAVAGFFVSSPDIPPRGIRMAEPSAFERLVAADSEGQPVTLEAHEVSELLADMLTTIWPQSEIEPDIAAVIYPNRSKLYWCPDPETGR